MENISELTKNTAENLHALLMKLAQYVEFLEEENAQLKERLANENVSK